MTISHKAAGLLESGVRRLDRLGRVGIGCVCVGVSPVRERKKVDAFVKGWAVLGDHSGRSRFPVRPER